MDSFFRVESCRARNLFALYRRPTVDARPTQEKLDGDEKEETKKAEEKDRTNVTGRMARDRSASEYSENVSDATSCSCITSSVDKASRSEYTLQVGDRKGDMVAIAQIARVRSSASRSSGRACERCARHRCPTDNWNSGDDSACSARCAAAVCSESRSSCTRPARGLAMEST